MTRSANIYDVAKLAGVSHQTVSRVLNNHTSVKPETRSKVEKAIAELQYRPNQAARQLVTSQSHIIGILISGSDLYGPWAIFNAMQREANLENYTLVSISVVPDSSVSLREAIEQLRNLGIDGVITIALSQKLITEVEKSLASAPIVIVDTEPIKKFDAVNIENFIGGQIATQHLIDLGHKKILHLTGPINGFEGQQRRRGYEAAMHKAKLTPNVIEGDWLIETGYELGTQIASGKLKASAIFTSNDHQALGAIKALSEKNIRVPEDLSIVGFDNIAEAKYFAPALTTIHQDFDELGKLAISRMLVQLKQPTKPQSLTVAPTLVIRESTKRLKASK